MRNFFFILSERVIAPIGEANHLEYLTPANFTQYLKKTDKCVIFFGSRITQFDFANFAISKFHKKVSFARAEKNLGIKYGCKTEKCILPFQNAQLLKANVAPKNPIDFANWIVDLISPPIITVDQPETIRKMFETPGSHVFGVKQLSRPEWLDKGKPFYNVDNQILQYLNLNLSSGIYVYRSADRQIVPVTQKYQNYIHSPLVDFRDPSIELHPIYGGVFMNPNSHSNSTQLQIQILTHLANKFPNISFGLIYDTFAKECVELGHFQNFLPPFFALFDSRPISEISSYPIFSEIINASEENEPSIPRRWAMLANSTNEEVLTEFVRKISNNEEPYTQISGIQYPITNNLIQVLTLSAYYNATHMKDRDVLVWFVDLQSYQSQELVMILNETKNIITKSNLTFFLYFIETNDIPPTITLSKIPFGLFYPANKNESIIFDDEFDVQRLIQFLILESSFPIEYKDYDPQEIRNRIARAMIPEGILEEESNITSSNNKTSSVNTSKEL